MEVLKCLGIEPIFKSARLWSSKLGISRYSTSKKILVPFIVVYITWVFGVTSGSLLTMRGLSGNQKRTFNPLYDQIGETWKRSIGGDLISSKSTVQGVSK